MSSAKAGDDSIVVKCHHCGGELSSIGGNRPGDARRLTCSTAGCPGNTMGRDAAATESADIGSDGDFRALVRSMRPMGFGRMAQIVDEEWRRVDPIGGGLLAICGKCKTLINTNDGSPR